MTGGVLYAEDDENDAFFMERAFALLKNKVSLTVVPHGGKVVELLSPPARNGEARGLPRLLLLDIKMPVMTGLEVLGWARQQPHLASLAIAMLTSSAEPKDIEFCRAKGANAYFIKPSQSLELAALAEQIVSALMKHSPTERFAVPGNQL